MSRPKNQGNDRLQYAFNLTLAGVAGQVGCLTLIIIMVALFAGLWLDNQFGTKPLLTILLMVGSMPVTLFLMFKIVRAATDRMKPVNNTEGNESSEEESNRD